MGDEMRTPSMLTMPKRRLLQDMGLDAMDGRGVATRSGSEAQRASLAVVELGPRVQLMRDELSVADGSFEAMATGRLGPWAQGSLRAGKT